MACNRTSTFWSISTGLALDTDRERLLALLSVAARRPMSADILDPVEAAAGHWRRGDKALAHLRLVFAGLPQLSDPTDAWRLRLAEILLDDGMSPRTLMVDLDLDPAVLTRAHYNPDQQRVLAGKGPSDSSLTSTFLSIETCRVGRPALLR